MKNILSFLEEVSAQYWVTINPKQFFIKKIVASLLKKFWLSEEDYQKRWFEVMIHHRAEDWMTEFALYKKIDSIYTQMPPWK